MLHWLAHVLRLNGGRVYSWEDNASGAHMIGFRCDGCGNIYGVHSVSTGLDAMSEQLNQRAAQCKERRNGM